MLDIKYIVENPEVVKEGFAKKGCTINVDELINLYLEVNKLKTSSQALAEEKNRLSNSIKSASSEERPSIIAKSKAIGEQFKAEQEKLAAEQAKLDEIMWRVPNLPSPETPVGVDDSQNVVCRKVGEIPSFSFEPKDHVEIMEMNASWSVLQKFAVLVLMRFVMNWLV